MNAAPEFFMGGSPGIRIARRHAPKPAPSTGNGWSWVAFGVLVVCWIGEATLCAARGF